MNAQMRCRAWLVTWSDEKLDSRILRKVWLWFLESWARGDRGLCGTQWGGQSSSSGFTSLAAPTITIDSLSCFGGMSPLLTSHNKLSMFHGDTMCSIHMKFITRNKFNGSDFVKSRQRGQIWLMAGCVGQFERWGGERPPHIHQHIFIYAAALKLVHPQNSSIFAI